jgi:NADPH-dependent 2,4-dienoyl-CoA reductase/sulfur reductase-like enzyme
MRYLILGSGPAGIAAAKAIRKRDRDSRVVIVSDERREPYLRPLLSDLLAGKTQMSAVADPQGEGLAAQGIELRLGITATRVESAGNKVRFSDGSEETYDILLVATGGRPAVPPPLAIPSFPIFPFDSLDDTMKIGERVGASSSVVVYGPGFLAIMASAGLIRRAREVIWFRPDKPVYGYPIGGELEANILDSVRNTGVRILDGHDIAAVRRAEERLEVVSTVGKETFRCEAVVVATERQPSVEFLAGSGIKTGRGVLVDDYLRTNVPNVYAAGDCAEVYDKEGRQTRINFGWRSAIKQGRLAGENMSGREKLYIRGSADYFWVLFGPALLDRIK